MAKNRNTMAKRQREAEKQDKAARKREKREKRQAESKDQPKDSSASEDGTGVLNIFRGYLMTAGKMLCLSGNELDTHRVGLQKLLDAGMLEAESFKGGYSLTSSGYVAMRRLTT